jgi:hypothetical protein
MSDLGDRSTLRLFQSHWVLFRSRDASTEQFSREIFEPHRLQYCPTCRVFDNFTMNLPKTTFSGRRPDEVGPPLANVRAFKRASQHVDLAPAHVRLSVPRATGLPPCALREAPEQKEGTTGCPFPRLCKEEEKLRRWRPPSEVVVKASSRRVGFL